MPPPLGGLGSVEAEVVAAGVSAAAGFDRALLPPPLDRAESAAPPDTDGGTLPSCVAATGVGDGCETFVATGCGVGMGGVGAATSLTTGAFASALAWAFGEFAPLLCADFFFARRPYEFETTGSDCRRTTCLVRTVCVTRVGRRPSAVPLTTRLEPVVAVDDGATRCAPLLIVGARWSLGTGTCGKCASAILRAGIDTAAAGGLSAARTAATPALVYGTVSAMMPKMPNQNRWRRVPRLWSPKVRVAERPRAPAVPRPPAYATDQDLNIEPPRALRMDTRP